ncbi:uncharacterized protein JCM6883_004291 [Sporobolomyces salmoneus]|uniref:uncharacterized protein n=1 Tax=Sporobolomyces salmoneus TaxID=183962 RepID=UPI00316B5AAE
MNADPMQPPPSSVYPGTPPQQHSSLFASSSLSVQSPVRQLSQTQQPQNTQPSTPLNEPSPRNAPSPQIKISPETLANLTSPYSQSNSVDSPASSTFSNQNLDPGNGGYSRAASLALANVVSGGGGQNPGSASGVVGSQQQQQNQLNGAMEVDMNYASYVQQVASSTNAFVNQATSAHPNYYYPPSNSAPATTVSTPANLTPNTTPSLAAHPPPAHPTVQRHHPYSRPSLSTHSSQNSAVPLYISTTPASISGTPPPTSAGIVESTSIGLGIPPLASQLPQRVHSAPAHILSLSTTGLDGFTGPELQSGESDNQGARDQRMMLGEGSQQQQAQEAALKKFMDAHAYATANGVSASRGGNAEGNGATSSSSSSLGPPFLSIEIPPTHQSTAHHPPPSAPPILTTTEEIPEDYNDAVSSAILLLQKRLPIMEAALTTSVVEPGQDEEEIWKGIEAAYGELRRIMGDRKDRRRQSAALGPKGSPTKARGRSFNRMDVESPSTAYPVSPFHATPPPLIHSHSTPNIPTTGQANAARQATIAQAQRNQQIQYEAQLQAQAQIQAETERARADEEQKVKQQEAEAEAQAQAQAQAQVQAQVQAQALAQAKARVEAEQEVVNQQQQQIMREQQAAAEHYQQLLHEESLRLARERLHQQMQEGAVGPNPNLPNPPPPSSIPPSSGFALPTVYTPSQSNPTPQPTTPTPTQAQPPVPVPSSSTSSSQTLAPSAYSNAFDPSATDLTLLQQMSLPNLAYTSNNNSSLPIPPDSIDPSTLVNQPQQLSSVTASTPQTSTSSGSPVTSHTPGSVAGSSGPIRPSRSRAASQSGSRSRAASGSGYQSLLESRSRAASSASSIFHPFERDEEDEMDEYDGGAGGVGEFEIDPDHSGAGTSAAHNARGGASAQMGAASAGVDPESKAKMDPIFLEFLADVCSNLDATDAKGEPIHQTLMAKKMEKLDQSHDFRPFKFRIQAFTTAFSERLTASGAFETEVPIKKIRQYLWAQPFISRFNDDGKKAKSKGNHIWTVEAKKMPDKRWMFREFVRCIKGPAPAIAFVGLNWSWAPRVWDPQCSSAAIDASFMSPSLPAWLSWEDNVLSGEAPEAAQGQSLDIEAVATFQMGDKVHQLRAMTTFLVASPNEAEDPGALSHAVSLHAAMMKAQEMRGGDEEYRTSTNSGSQDVSPAGSSLPLYRSPSMGSSSVFEQQQQLVVPGDNGPFGASDFGQLPQPPQMFTGEVPQVEMQLDDSMANSLQAQAALHQHYSNLALQNAPFHGGLSASSLSYPPPPDLVTNALQDAATNGVNPAYTMTGAMLPHPPTNGAGTPGTVFQLRDMGQQPPFTTLDPSQL